MAFGLILGFQDTCGTGSPACTGSLFGMLSSACLNDSKAQHFTAPPSPLVIPRSSGHLIENILYFCTRATITTKNIP